MASETTTWTEDAMIESTLEWWGRDDFEASDCVVREGTDDDGEQCLIVLHRPTGRTSTEAGNRGRWHLDGTAYED